MALTLAEAKSAQTQPGFNLAQAAQAATVGSPTYVPPNPTQPVSTNNLSSNLSVPPATTSNPSPFVGSIMDSQKYFQDLYNKQTAELDAARKDREDLKKILGESYAQLDTIPDFYRKTEESLGIPKQYEDLNKINLQIADLTGAYDKEFARVETKGIQSGTPAIFYQGEQGAIQRQKAVEIGALSVRQAAMAGNLDLANQRAAKVTEIQFQPIENKIKRILDFIQMNYQDMTAAEKRQADTLQNALTFQQAQLAEQKEIRNLALTSGVTQPYFMKVGDPTVYRTSDGKAYSSEQEFLKDGGNFSKVQTINPAESSQVQQLMKDYGDAGILPSDSLAVATVKLQKSRIYQDKVRPPSSGGGNAVTIPGIGTLTNTQIDNISPIVSSFRSEPIVQNYNTIAEGYEFVRSLSNTTKNPADDQALIYALAKALDPGSVVREGEYATVQKYAQSLVNSYGKSVTQALSGTGFLSESARQNIKSTIESRYNAAAKNYENIYNETARRVELVGGLQQGSGSQFLNNYSGGYTVSPSFKNDNFIEPVNPTKSEEIVTTPETKGWWAKTTNWLWGED